MDILSDFLASQAGCAVDAALHPPPPPQHTHTHTHTHTHDTAPGNYLTRLFNLNA